MANAICLIETCSKNADGCRGWCSSHYQRWLRHGDPLGGNKSPSTPKAIDFPDGTRQCTKCSQRLPIDSFSLDSNASRGRRAQCKTCRCTHEKTRYNTDPDVRHKQRQHRAENAEAYRRYDNQRYKRDRDKRIALASDSSHRRRKRIANSERIDRGINANALRKRDGSRCYLCKRTMDFTAGRQGKYNPRRASVEHLIPIAQGGLHVWDNVVLTCLACNLQRPKKAGPGGEQLLLLG